MDPAKIYKPQTARVVPWNKIEEYYADLINHGLTLQSMLSLVRFIRGNDFDKRLYAFTSMHKLVISIYDPPEWNREALHIEFDMYSKKFILNTTQLHLG